MSTETSPTSLGLRSPIEVTSRFFHAKEVPYGMALVRIFLPWTLFFTHIGRWFYTREIFSTDGATTPLWNSYGYFGLLPELNGEVMVALHTLMLFCLVTASIGWCTRISLIVSTVLFTYTNMLDCIGTIAKYSCIGTHALLILSMSRCGDVWSVDAWLKGWNRRENAWPGEARTAWPASEVWARRLMQLCLGFVYFGAGVTKLKTTEFFSGNQLVSWMITNVNFEHGLGEFMSMHPALLIVLAYITVVWELTFPFVIWSGWGRVVAFTIGVGFHISTYFMLGLTTFPALCLSMYFAFLNENDFRVMAHAMRKVARKNKELWSRIAAWWPRINPPQRAWLPAPVVMVMACCGVAVAGVGLEHYIDPYGVRRPEGKYTLKEIDPEFVAEMMRPAPPLKDKDVFFSLDVGSFLAGNVLLQQQTTFKAGDKVIAQVFLIAPHVDMLVSCDLHDSEDRVVNRSSTIMAREVQRGTFTYSLGTALEPGSYYLVLKNGSTEITRRELNVLPGPHSLVRAPLAQ